MLVRAPAFVQLNCKLVMRLITADAEQCLVLLCVVTGRQVFKRS